MMEHPQTREEPKDSTFNRWYRNHRSEFAERRRKRYATDPEYKAKALEQVRRYRARRQEEAGQKRPDEYHLTLDDLFENLDISAWQYQAWRKKNYFPEPKRFERGVVYFTSTQQSLIGMIAETLRGRRKLTPEESATLQGRVNLAHVNWES